MEEFICVSLLKFEAPDVELTRGVYFYPYLERFLQESISFEGAGVGTGKFYMGESWQLGL